MSGPGASVVTRPISIASGAFDSLARTWPPGKFPSANSCARRFNLLVEWRGCCASKNRAAQISQVKSLFGRLSSQSDDIASEYTSIGQYHAVTSSTAGFSSL